LFLVELIGPWYAAQDGDEYGFNDLWYKDISLDSNGTSIIFQESGLHLIYAQVRFFHQLVRVRVGINYSDYFNF
jgi:hypothetical protein